MITGMIGTAMLGDRLDVDQFKRQLEQARSRIRVSKICN